MKTRNSLILALAGLVAVSGCDQAARMSEKGFRLPDGDAEAGRVTLMAIHNDYMTVQQLIDIVMFLQPTYEVVPPEYHYRSYHYPGL